MAKKPRLPRKPPVAPFVTSALGAPTKFAPQTIARILKSVRTGFPITLAARAAGINYDTLNEWRKQGQADLDAGRKTPHSDFSEALIRNEAEAAQDLFDEVVKAGKLKDARHLQWILERRFNEFFGAADRVGAGNPQFIIVTILTELKRLLPDPEARIKLAEALEAGTAPLALPEPATP